MQENPTNQAMTEVALGLSMAFFALLIVALISISQPNTNKQAALNSKDKIEVTDSEKESGQVSQTQDDKTQWLIYYQSQYFDQNLKIQTPSSYSKHKALVLAVSPLLKLNEIISLKQKINHPKLSITQLNQQWLDRLKAEK